MIKYYKKFSILLDSIYRTFPNLDNNLNKIRTHINRAIKATNSLNNCYLETVFVKINHIHNLSNEIVKKHISAIELLPLLEEKIEISTESSSKIITNLQYQDIVRQKIEHVKDAHNEIVNQLEQVTKSKNNPNELLSKAKLFLKIRDIAGLQAAQLIHANKEYQNAIETITLKFLDIGYMMEDLADICKSLNNTNGKQFHNDYISSDNYIQSIKVLKQDIISIQNLFKGQIDAILPQIEILESNYDLLIQFCNTFQNLVDSIKSKEKKDQIETSANHSDILGQLTKLSDSLLKVVEKTEPYVSNTHSLINQIEEITLTKEVKNQEKQLIQSINNLFKYADNLVKNSVISWEVEDEMDKLYAISEKIKTSVEDIKYYDLFEKEIENMINNLDDISKKLKIEDLDLQNQLESLDDIKQHYTMQTEFLIHEKISNEMDKGSIELFNDDALDNIQADDNSDVEFF
jgi:hypothetical protein